jgi:hypothetical protein
MPVRRTTWRGIDQITENPAASQRKFRKAVIARGQTGQDRNQPFAASSLDVSDADEGVVGRGFPNGSS